MASKASTIKSVISHGRWRPKDTSWPRISFDSASFKAAVFDALQLPRTRSNIIAVDEAVNSTRSNSHDCNLVHFINTLHAFHANHLTAAEWKHLDHKLQQRCSSNLHRQPSPPSPPSPPPPPPPPRTIGQKRKLSASKHWKWRQLIRRQEAEIKQLRDRVKELEARLSYKHQPVRQRSKGKICRISVHAGYRLALQRNCGHAGNPSLLLTLDLHSTKQIIPKWEILLACNWLLQRR